MNWSVVQRVLGLLLMMFSLTMLPPVPVSFLYGDGAWLPFLEGFALTLLAGLVIWFPVRKVRRELRLRDGFLVVASFWTVLGTFGAAPLYLSDTLSMSLTDTIRLSFEPGKLEYHTLTVLRRLKPNFTALISNDPLDDCQTHPAAFDFVPWL